jgi:RHS repeat-associated protein
MYTGGASYYYHPDALGSVANLTKSTGATEWTCVYEPFGSPRSTTQNDPSAPTNVMRYTGQLLDSGTSLYHLRARQHDSSNGRFLQLDPQAPRPSDAYFSSYVYAQDRPTVLTDPSGRGGGEPVPSGQFCRVAAIPAAVVALIAAIPGLSLWWTLATFILGGVTLLALYQAGCFG